MSKINSRQKGAAGEREFAKLLLAHGCPEAYRGRQYHGRDEAPDVCCSWPIHLEVKRVQALNILKAMEQAVGDTGEDEIPAVAHRKNGKPWLITMHAEDLLPILAAHYEDEA